MVTVGVASSGLIVQYSASPELCSNLNSSNAMYPVPSPLLAVITIYKINGESFYYDRIILTL